MFSLCCPKFDLITVITALEESMRDQRPGAIRQSEDGELDCDDCWERPESTNHHNIKQKMIQYWANQSRSPASEQFNASNGKITLNWSFIPLWFVSLWSPIMFSWQEEKFPCERVMLFVQGSDSSSDCNKHSPPPKFAQILCFHQIASLQVLLFQMTDFRDVFQQHIQQSTQISNIYIPVIL